jgi:uncharacterized protein
MLQAQIFIDQDEFRGMQPLGEFIMAFLLEHHIAGATAFNGQFGFGKNHKIKKPNQIFSFDETPMVIIFIDQDEKVRHVLAELRKHYRGGLIVAHEVMAY